MTGASSGIGQAVAGDLLNAGVEVFGTTRNPETARGPEGIRWLRLEGSTPEGTATFIEENRELLEGLDILINNAGWSAFGEVAGADPVLLVQQIQLLLQTPVQLTHAVLPGMQARGRGCVVNVSSLAAVFPLPFMAAYSAGKAGLSTFTQSLNLSAGSNGVRFVDFQAGDFRTSFNEHMSRQEVLNETEKRAWQQFEKHLQAAPKPERAARDILRAIQVGRNAVVRSGGFFQTRLAPLGMRILPVSWLLRAIKWYYKLPSG